MSEPQLEPVKSNGKHFCTETGRLQKLSTESTEQRAMLADLALRMKSMSDAIADQGIAIISLSDRLGRQSPDPTKPELATGLIGAVTTLVNRQLKQEQEIGTVREVADSLAEKEEITEIQSRDELIARAKAAEAKAEKADEDRRKMVMKIALAVLSGGGVAGLAKALMEMMQ